MFFTISGCCVPIPWNAWTYEHQANFSNYPSPWNLPDLQEFEELYIDGVFIYIQVRAHDETTTNGSSPFYIIVNSTSNNPEHESITFHSIKIGSSQNLNHLPRPVEVNNAAKISKYLEFPVAKQFEFHSESVVNPTPSIEGIKTASLWTDENLEFAPIDGEVITISIDVEVLGSNSAYRKIIEYEFFPHHESGVMQCISA